MTPNPDDERGLRRDADRILRAALAAVNPSDLVKTALQAELERHAPLAAALRSGRGLRIVAVGKAAVGMTEGALAALPAEASRRVEGIVHAPQGGPEPDSDLPAGLRLRRGGHPLPTPGGVGAAREILGLLERSGPDDPILFLLSGGGSALLALPDGEVSLDDLRATTQSLLDAGAAIHELNAVRKHVERTKGGLLARAASPAPVVALVISDVVGDRLDRIASGPLWPDPTTFRDAIEVLERFGLSSRIPEPVLAHLLEGAAGARPDTPGPDDPCFAGVTTHIVGSVGTATLAGAAAARDSGYRPHVLGTHLSGEAREVGRRLGALARSVRGAPRRDGPVCLVSGGETTVTVSGTGRGGRNQELVLGAALEIDGEEGVVVASFGTDGVDGPTDAAGALATGSTLARARRMGLSARDALLDNDTYAFFHSLGDLIVTGPTGTNVMDVQIMLIR